MKAMSGNKTNDNYVDTICEDIEYELKYCKNSKIDQYYRYGRLIDCENIKLLNVDCFEWKKTAKNDSFKRLSDYDKNLIENRRKLSTNNDVWTYRQRPPYDWNSKLPEWCEERMKTTLWYKHREAEKK
jgi:hypothetical protein